MSNIISITKQPVVYSNVIVYKKKLNVIIQGSVRSMAYGLIDEGSWEGLIS